MNEEIKLNESRMKERELIQANDRLQSELNTSRTTNQQLTDEINRSISQLTCEVDGTAASCDEKCPSHRICPRKVLLVGGMTKMKKFY